MSTNKHKPAPAGAPHHSNIVTSTATVVTHFQAIASDNLVMLNLWTKNGIPDSWVKRNFLGWSFAWLDQSGNRMPLRSWIPFEGQDNKKWEPALHDLRPVQSSSWFHYDPQVCTLPVEVFFWIVLYGIVRMSLF